jgi:hypothetical protein
MLKFYELEWFYDFVHAIMELGCFALKAKPSMVFLACPNFFFFIFLFLLTLIRIWVHLKNPSLPSSKFLKLWHLPLN